MSSEVPPKEFGVLSFLGAEVPKVPRRTEDGAEVVNGAHEATYFIYVVEIYLSIVMHFKYVFCNQLHI